MVLRAKLVKSYLSQLDLLERHLRLAIQAGDFIRDDSYKGWPTDIASEQVTEFINALYYRATRSSEDTRS